MKDVCTWAAVSDEMWVHFAEQLGDASLQNISLVAAMQPDDIKEAIEVAITGVVARTRLRLVCAAARLKFSLDPVDVGAPLLAAPAEPVCVGPRGGGGAPTAGSSVGSRGREDAHGGSQQVAGEVQSSGRGGPNEGGGGHRRSIVGDLHGGAGRDRAIRRFRCVASIRATCGQEHEVCVPFLGQFRKLEEQRNSWTRLIVFVGGVLACLPHGSHYVRFRSTRSVGPIRSSIPHESGAFPGQLAVVCSRGRQVQE